MSELVFDSVADGPLVRVDAGFGPGCSLVLGSDPLALATFVALAGGARAARRGHVLFDGSALYASPGARRAAATLFAEERLDTFGSVAAALGRALEARGEHRDALGVLNAAGLSTWAERRARELDASESRTLALVLSLTHPSPRLVCLYEPLAAGRSLSADFVRDGIRRAASSGAVVLAATTNLDDARSLGGQPWLLDAGVLVAPTSSPFTATGEKTFIVATSDARRVMEALAREPSVSGVRFHDRHTPDALLVTGDDLEAVASTLTRTLCDTRAAVRSLVLAPLPLDALLVARQAPPATPELSVRAPEHAPTPPSLPGGAPSGSPHAGLPELAPAPADQAVSMPTSFADPTRPRGGGDP